MLEDSEQKEYERFLAHRETLLSIQKHNLVTFDKAIITLSSGALGLSLIFIEKIVGSGVVECKLILLFSWTSYLISILCNLSSYRNGFREAKQQMIELDEHLRKNQEYSYILSKKYRVTEGLNEVSFWLFALGTILLCIFAYLNIGG